MPQLRYIGLLSGLLLVISSLIFFGRKEVIYIPMAIIGVIISLISYLIILFKDRWQSKIIWTLIIVVSILIQRLTESGLIKQSYKILISQNKLLLDSVN